MSIDPRGGALPTLAGAPFIDELRDWLPANDEPARPLIALATMTPEGYPDVRHVLLSEFTDEGFFFHTDARSRKIAELTRLGRASFAIAWPDLGRQLVVVGTTEPASAQEAASVYARRSSYLQVLAWLNDPSFAARALDERQRLWADFESEHPHGTLTPPENWAGVLIRPIRVTFWHGRPDTASQRTEFTAQNDGSWSTTVLPG